MSRLSSLSFNTLGKVQDAAKMLLQVQAEGTPCEELQLLKAAVSIEMEKRAAAQFNRQKGATK